MSLDIETRKGPPERLMLIAAAMQARKAPKRSFLEPQRALPAETKRTFLEPQSARPVAAPRPKTPRKRDRSGDMRRYREAQARGDCVECRERKAVPGKTRCETCFGAKNRRQAASRQRRIEAGICADCPRPCVPGNRRCEPCKEKARQQAAKRKAAR